VRHLNYGHLQYFYTVAKHGGVTRAGRLLHLTPQTISGQLRLLEETIGRPLFDRVGRRLVLTETGHLVYRYAEEIFTLGGELAQVVHNRMPAAPTVLNVGVTQSLPKLVAHRMIAPALALKDQFRIVCFENNLEELLSELALHNLDVVLSDRPVPHGTSIKAYSHFLGECGTTFFCKRSAWKRTRRRFPKSLDDAALLLPRPGTALRSQIDAWLERSDVTPKIAYEFDDSALLKAFGMEGAGVFPGPSAIEREICSMYRVIVVGRTPDVSERFYAISPERRLKHPAVVAISDAARNRMFTSKQ
jgi:LysR family transcriptional regulator, transcriptional activator of nhaA